MNQTDLFYRAFTEYKKHTKTNMDCVRFRREAQALKSPENELLTAVFSSCTIEEDWIKAIEEGIPFILKAIKEERQFIRNDGEVLPIEKVRKTSKYSIQDLAKHSNYISHEAPEHINAEIVPDKVLIIRKENDYTVYENRVLYAALLHMQEFVALRLNKIKELTNKYEANAKFNKHIIVGNRIVDFDLNFNEIIKDDPIAIKKNSYQDLIIRIETIYANIVSLLKTPLMVECSKVDVVSRPITKTNVLRMNRNFKESLKVYDYVAEYTKPGYSVETFKKTFNPFTLLSSYDFAELINLTSFITYMHINGITDDLKHEYDAEEKRLKQEEENKILAKSRRINAKAKAEGKTLQEYLLILDEANRILEKRVDELNEIQDKIEKEHKQEITTLNEAHTSEVNKLNSDHRHELDQINDTHNKEIEALNENHSKEVEELNTKHNEEISNLNIEHEERVNLLTNDLSLKQNEIDQTKKDCEDKINSAQNEFEKLKCELIAKTTQEIDEMRTAKEKAEAELLAIRLQNGIKVDPNTYTSEERFNQLEKEKKYLDEFYKDAWKATKKAIRKQVMSEKPSKLFKKKEAKVISDSTLINKEEQEGQIDASQTSNVEQGKEQDK